MPITCTVCGTVNPDGTQYCEGCGVELTPAAAPAAPQNPAGSAQAARDDLSEAAPEVRPVPEPTSDQFPAQNAANPLSESAAPLQQQSAPAPEAVYTPAAEVSPAPEYAPEPVPVPLAESSEAALPEPQVIYPPQAEIPRDSTTVITPTDLEKRPAETPVQGAAGVAASPETASVPVVSPAPQPARLAFKRFGALTGDVVPLHAGRMVVGRFDASTGPVEIDVSGLPGAEHVSRRHAELYLEGGRWMVRDLGSTNGVFVKRAQDEAFGPRLTAPVALEDGDELAFGNMVVVFQRS
ncbi:hypothetical protein HNR42_002081 [Deinobacterium chartae]|uniref:FHA domain-containing protein n=1 Tax=Deinobacterium chartae TaxID=521158 RepID=A0A841I0L8_9DEIO|nr:FHA domain-containing protein [Deinobacterium chartae]MBB6098646.1 hypothetical protein [Deinobacterium chartae]